MSNLQSKNESLNESLIRVKEELHQVHEQKNKLQNDLQQTLKDLAEAQRKQSVAEAGYEIAGKVSDVHPRFTLLQHNS